MFYCNLTVRLQPSSITNTCTHIAMETHANTVWRYNLTKKTTLYCIKRHCWKLYIQKGLNKPKRLITRISIWPFPFQLKYDLSWVHRMSPSMSTTHFAIMKNEGMSEFDMTLLVFYSRLITWCCWKTLHCLLQEFISQMLNVYLKVCGWVLHVGYHYQHMEWTFNLQCRISAL